MLEHKEVSNHTKSDIYYTTSLVSTMAHETSIYVLRLEGGRYYIGKSDNVMKRYEEHLNGAGSAWTTRYPPVSLVKTMNSVSAFEEDKTVKEYMAIYGIDMVRGGSYVTEALSATQRSVLQQEIWSAQDRCSRCGSSGHWVSTCRHTYISQPKGGGYRTQSVGKCFRCGRAGHFVGSCYASTDARGYELEDDSDDDDDDDY
jgi:predicted GIY-YIG superfamily endonuclease